ncbi:exostosin family protein [Formosa sp. PL04]|uniref:exostosin domain-containing protein n=1 Tax=Formosa sp. PL04 TaxID=3081755 RepID=UPI0029828B87|nr:exostosin family protein [Formosa sp. PL04]MDW5290736.1 exostosin family protein [Formosa sp. PL04]
MKIYYPSHLYDSQFRGQLFPLLKPFLKNENFTDAERVRVYGVSEQDFEIVETIEACDVIVLPMSWYYFARTKQMDLAYKFVEEAKQVVKPIWSINNGDFGVKLSKIKNLTVFRQGGYVINNQEGHVGYPSFIQDYLSLNNLKDLYLESNYDEFPKVGFCGQAKFSRVEAVKELTKQVLRNFKNYSGLSKLEPQDLLSNSYLRGSLLKKLEINPKINSLFIKRKQYRAGVTENKETHNTTIQFYNNILESQYVLCVRGAGNFSVRFYETLMMGRIPLYVHTDGYLPLSDEIDWKKHVVWVDYKDRHLIGEILLDFHQKLDQEKLLSIFKKNRTLWEEKLTLSGFFYEQKRILIKNSHGLA